MRVKIQQFLFGKQHSWSEVGQNIGRALIKRGHDVEFVSTDGFEDKYCPSDIKPFVKQAPSGAYDCQIGYTAPHNWGSYFVNGDKNRFAIWAYEYLNKNSKGVLLGGFGKNYKNVDAVIPVSGFTKKVFLNMGIPDDKMVVIPHGFNVDEFKTENVYPLKTKKKIKILLVISQPHKRKALDLALESFGKAFTKDDDVCFVIKINTSNHQNGQFDVDFFKMYKTFEQKYPKHAEVEIITGFIPNIAELYRACDINFTATHAECFHLPSLQALAAGLINVVPNYGGQLDFCNSDNSIFIDGSEVRAPADHQYWSFNPSAVHFKINTSDAASKLKFAVSNFESLKQKLAPHIKLVCDKYTWDNVGLEFERLCK